MERSIHPGRKNKFVIDFPQDLFEETESAAVELSISRSSLIRAAVEAYLRNLRRKKLEQELIDGYVANAELSRKTCEEFAHIDSELH